MLARPRGRGLAMRPRPRRCCEPVYRATPCTKIAGVTIQLRSQHRGRFQSPILLPR
jgi:hypothetical protein